MRLRPRRKGRARPTAATMRRRLKSQLAGFLKTTGDVVRLFGWLYVVVLVPTLLVAIYFVIRAATSGGDVLRSLHMFPLAMIWPLAAVALRSDGAFSLTFPLNALVLVASVALVIVGWTVLLRVVRDFIRWRRM
jgi:hypothetical protein